MARQALFTQNPLEVVTNLVGVVGAKLWIASMLFWGVGAGFLLLHQDAIFQNSFFQKLAGKKSFADVFDSEADIEKRCFTLLINFALLMLFGGIFEFAYCMYCFFRGVYRFFFMKGKDLVKRYGAGTWVVITGPDGGQGRRFTFEFAEKGFNIMMIGYGKRCNETRSEVLDHLKKNNMKEVEIRVIGADFRYAAEHHFFDIIENAVKDLDVSVLINNVGHRFGWTAYHEMPEEKINDSIICGTIVQSRMTRMILPKFVQRYEKFEEAKKNNKESELEFETSALINITAQCLGSALGPSLPRGPELSLPYLSCYEAANVFGYFHGMSIHREYYGKLDILNVTPGAVLTENTYPALKTIPFACDEVTYAKNIMRFVGNVQGAANCHWGHALSVNILPIAPFMLTKTCENTGYTIAKHYKKLYESGEYGGPARITRKASSESHITASTASLDEFGECTASTVSTTETNSMQFSPVKQHSKMEGSMRLRAAVGGAM